MLDKPKILAVDDEKINLNILIGLLGDLYEVSVALNVSYKIGDMKIQEQTIDGNLKLKL